MLQVLTNILISFFFYVAPYMDPFIVFSIIIAVITTGIYFIFTKSIKKTLIICMILILISSSDYFYFHFVNQFIGYETQSSNPGPKKIVKSDGVVNKASAQDKIDCKSWDYCTDFKSDADLNNINHYYQHSSNDPQILTLQDAPFANPPLYFDTEIKPFYYLQLDVQPLNSKAANIIIESKGLYQLFIGDNDYRSLALLTWDNNKNLWIRTPNSKIYLMKDLHVPDIQPKTQFTVKINVVKDRNNALLNIDLNYRSIKDGSPTHATFSKKIFVPAIDPEQYLTKVGVEMYRSEDSVPQGKFYFMGLRQIN